MRDVVVILSFFGRADTERCVESLRTGSPAAQLLVIDNGSFDGVLESVRGHGVATLQTGTNLGFAGGMNRGLQWALDAGAATITVLNNDTVLPAGAISALAEIARTGVVVSPEVRYLDDPARIWFGGGVIDDRTGLARHLSAAELAEVPAVAGLRPSPVLAGCCLTATADTWRRVGLFDERYFLNFEDSEWSLRATRAGVPLAVAPGVRVLHAVSASFTGAYSYLGLFYYTRNGLLFGATRKPWDVAGRLRFLRRHVLPVLGSDLRQRQWGDAGRHGALIAAAVALHLVRRYGRAPRLVERLAERWARG